MRLRAVDLGLRDAANDVRRVVVPGAADSESHTQRAEVATRADPAEEIPHDGYLTALIREVRVTGVAGYRESVDDATRNGARALLRPGHQFGLRQKETVERDV